MATSGRAELRPEERSGGAQSNGWSVVSGGYKVSLTSNDIVWSPAAGGAREYSLRRVLAERRARWLADLGVTEEEECTTEITASVVSIVGRQMSLDVTEYTGCPRTAHPSIERRYAVIDLEQPMEPWSIQTYFSDSVLLDGLLTEPIIRRHLGEERPATIDALIERLQGMGECEYGVGEDLLERYAYHHLSGDSVAVWFGLSHGAEPCRGRLTRLGVMLPIPPQLRTALTRAAQRSEGFLGNDRGWMGSGKEVRFVLGKGSLSAVVATPDRTG